MSHEIMQAFVEDHVSPFMKALGAMQLKAGRVRDLPPLPPTVVEVVHGVGVGGPYIKMLPTAALMAWATEVRARAEARKIPVDGAIRREGVASRDGSVGYMELPAITIEAERGPVIGVVRHPHPSVGGAS